MHDSDGRPTAHGGCDCDGDGRSGTNTDSDYVSWEDPYVPLCVFGEKLAHRQFRATREDSAQSRLSRAPVGRR